MKINEKKSSPVPFIAAFCFIYIILSARPLSTELHLKPEWTESIQNVKPVIAKEELIPFRLSQNIGYFTKDGRIVSCISFPFKATISDSRFAYYGADSLKKIGTAFGIGHFFFGHDTISRRIHHRGLHSNTPLKAKAKRCRKASCVP